jgi:L-lactate dehydrogenase complex protein LldE
MFFPEIPEKVVRLLRSLGVEVDFPAGQTCCGMPLFNSGYRAEAAEVARRTIPLFEGAEYVVVPSGSCAAMLRHEYPVLMDDPAWRRRAQDLARRTYELTQFLVNVLGRTRFRSAVSGRLAYHASCHLLRGLGEARTPVQLLENLEGAEVVALPGHDECCGFGGSFAVRMPEVSTAMLDRKVANIEGTGAQCVVACDAGCLMQMGGRLSRRGSAVRAVHLVELLAEALEERQ